MPANTPQALTLRQLNAYVTRTLSVPQLQNVWVVAELSDLRVSGGHCYMELVEKNPATGAIEARIRGIIWAGTFGRLSASFLAATGQRLASGQKVMACGSVNYHSAYGMSFVISDIDPAYTMGEAERLRREILQRLKAEGVLELNRQLTWSETPLRIAVVSAKGAAGYGDFVNQLYNNSRHLRFVTRLFPAVLQGERTAPSVIAALDAIASEYEQWDCVVLIRGGGATSDLAAFDNYDLANNVAQFPLPVIVGIGHERDVTVLDYVANMRVKTPTAAAEWLIAQGGAALDRLHSICSDIVTSARERIAGSHTQLAYLDSLLPIAPAAAIERADNRLTNAATSLKGTAAVRIAPAKAGLDATAKALTVALPQIIARAAERLESTAAIIDALSPQATLRRGYSIVRQNGKSVRSVSAIAPGESFETVLADGSFLSTRQQ